MILRLLLGALLALLVCGAAAQTASQTADRSHQVQADVEQGELTYQVPPTYPPLARQARVQGTVVLHALIGKDGSIQELEVVSGHPMLVQAALDAVKQWRYKPYFYNGEPAVVETNINVNFQLSDTPGQAHSNEPPANISSAETGSSKPSPAAQPSQNQDSDQAPRAYRVGGGVTAPKLINAPDPVYSKEARKARYEGTVVLWMIVSTEGLPQDIKVQRALGMGLDEEAIRAVKQWRFEPATKDGKPVPVMINVEVNFRLRE